MLFADPDSTCAAICLAVPAVSVADAPQNRNQSDAQHGKAQAAGKGPPPGAHAPAGGQPPAPGINGVRKDKPVRPASPIRRVEVVKVLDGRRKALR
jgi:hypothetical protein